MNSIKGTPAYWKKFKSEDLTIVKQLSVPTLFLTFSCADLRWDELMEIIQKLSKADKVDVDKSNLSYYARCSVIILILVGGRGGGDSPPLPAGFPLITQKR